MMRIGVLDVASVVTVVGLALVFSRTFGWVGVVFTVSSAYLIGTVVGRLER